MTPTRSDSPDRRPVILAVDDDPQVLRAIRRDLRRAYSARYRILAAGSPGDAEKVLSELAGRGEEPALLVSDQRMPGGSGVDFLRGSMTLFPDARRVLLTAYADTEAAIAAINEARLDHYLMKPWEPPEERFYPVLDDLLNDWQASKAEHWQGIRVFGQRFSPDTHAVRDFLTRHLVPFRFTDVDREPDSVAGLLPPVVEFPDGERLASPELPELAARLGLTTVAERRAYDLVIVGAGPAGLAAAVYGASEGLSTIAIDREAPGGQAGTSSRIENYLGFPAGLSGGDLARRAAAQARRLGAEILAPQEVAALRVEGAVKVLTLTDGTEITAQALILATGVSYNRLDVPGAAALEGAGLYYGAASTEAMSCAGQTVCVIGGANSAGQAAMYFAKYADRVIMLVRGASLEARMSTYLIEQIRAVPTIEVRPGTRVLGMNGGGRLESVTVSGPDGEETLPAEAAVTFIGASPCTGWLPGDIELDEHGFVVTGGEGRALLESTVPGVFAAGDTRSGAMRRVASAVGEGAMAVAFVHEYLAAP
ncbi:FAD-dependent oxidoreductase [Nonomuraea sp. LPB2021202275-12-8]|uniref:FAD-dependent oxidoreductase n=1 Tax=Nonomuraea sp. LPB2021202275-12-8 TaxID=3120159 RepID=UPI00300C62F5